MRRSQVAAICLLAAVTLASPAPAGEIRQYTCEICLQGLVVPDRGAEAWERAAPQTGESYRQAGESIASGLRALGAALEHHVDQRDIVPAPVVIMGASGEIPPPPPLPDGKPVPGSFQRFDQWRKNNSDAPLDGSTKF